MKPDKALTVEKWIEELANYHEAHGEQGHKMRVIRRIQRAAFEKGAKAQMRKLLKYWSQTDDCLRRIADAPLVEFEEEVRCGEDGPAGGTREGAPGEES